MNYVEEGLTKAEILANEWTVPFMKYETNVIDYINGVDCIFDENKTDVKCTESIILCKTMLDTGKFTVRHPFRTNSEATHYLIFPKTGAAPLFQQIKYHLLSKFFKNQEGVDKIKVLLNTLDNSEISNIKSTYLKLKTELKALVKQDVYILFTEPNEENIAKFNMKDVYLELKLKHPL